MQEIYFILNVQHDCRDAGCGPTGEQIVLQERLTTLRTVPTIEHRPTDRFVINMHALHNASLIRLALDRELVCPIRFQPPPDAVAPGALAPDNVPHDRPEWLEAQGRKAQTKGMAKRKATAAKSKVTRDAKKVQPALNSTNVSIDSRAPQAPIASSSRAAGSSRGRGQGRGAGRASKRKPSVSTAPSLDADFSLHDASSSDSSAAAHPKRKRARINSAPDNNVI